MRFSIFSGFNIRTAQQLTFIILRTVFFCCAVLFSPIYACAQQEAGSLDDEHESRRSQEVKPARSMIIGMKPGETHLTRPTKNVETQSAPRFEIETASISTRYHFIDDSRGVTIANNNQYQMTFKGRLRLDRQGKFSIYGGVLTGNSFNGGWNASGWGTGRGQGNLFLKQLYLSAAPVRGIEIQFGGLYFEYGESTEITSYDFDGYFTGERLKITRPKDLYFDEVSITYGYIGDLNQPGVNKRWHRLQTSNYHQFLVARHFGKRTKVSADYTFESGIDTFRQAVKVQARELRVIDTFHFENYQRAGDGPGYGFGVYGEKSMTERFSLGGGFARVDRSGLNSDRFPRGKRLHLNGHLALSSEFSMTVSFTQAFANNVSILPRRRLDVAISYNLLQTLKKTGLF